MFTLADKINRLLDDRGLLRRDLARALAVSPSTATDICKGRSAVTVRHLRRLVQFFGLRADYWLDDSRLEPSAFDDLVPALHEKLHAIARTGILDAEDPAGLLLRLLEFARRHGERFVVAFGEPTPEERHILSLPALPRGDVGRIEGSGETV
jgi:transcriptional regulator with XRE-family HTH domain